MSRVEKHFSAFGQLYKSRHLSATEGLRLMQPGRENHPTELLALTWAKREDGDWELLDNGAAINEYVVDKANALPPRMVLQALISLINEYNYGFLDGWSGIRIPTRFLDGSAVASSKHVDPLVSQLVSSDVASMRELEEYYSLEDAFKMFDLVLAKGVNQALANEAAIKGSK